MNLHNKVVMCPLRKLSSFLQTAAKKQPIHSGSCWRRCVVLYFCVSMGLVSCGFYDADDKVNLKIACKDGNIASVDKY